LAGLSSLKLVSLLPQGRLACFYFDHVTPTTLKASCGAGDSVRPQGSRPSSRPLAQSADVDPAGAALASMPGEIAGIPRLKFSSRLMAEAASRALAGEGSPMLSGIGRTPCCTQVAATPPAAATAARESRLPSDQAADPLAQITDSTHSKHAMGAPLAQARRCQGLITTGSLVASWCAWATTVPPG